MTWTLEGVKTLVGCRVRLAAIGLLVDGLVSGEPRARHRWRLPSTSLSRRAGWFRRQRQRRRPMTDSGAERGLAELGSGGSRALADRNLTGVPFGAPRASARPYAPVGHVAAAGAVLMVGCGINSFEA